MQPWNILHRLMDERVDKKNLDQPIKKIERRNCMKKIFTLLLSGAMIAAFVSPVHSPIAYADTQVTDMPMGAEVMPIKAEEPVRLVDKNASNSALEAAIKEIKSKIAIPKDYSKFDYYYSDTNSYTGGIWSLTWKKPGDSSYIQVNCDSDYHITYYNHYIYSEKANKIPTYLKNELKGKAEDFLKKIVPVVYSKLEYMESNFDSIYNNTYTYVFQRKENGVLFPENGATVSVDGATGEIKHADINWLYGVSVPDAETKLTKEEAAELIDKNMNMKLSYRMNYFRIFNGDSSSFEKKAFLVYEPDQGYISVDAKTGEVYLSKVEWVNNLTYAKGAAETTAADRDTGGAYLSEEEIAKINELEKLITKEKAIELVTKNSYLYIDKNLSAYSAYLNKTDNGSGKNAGYVWNINFSDNRPFDADKNADNYRGYASATVDAMTGKILGFNTSIKGNYNDSTGKWNSVKIKYDQSESLAILEKFLKGQIKDRFDHSKLVSQNEDYIAYYKNENTPVYGGYLYRYNRVNEGVEFAYNGISGAVDGVTGKIYSFYCNWEDDIKFESPKGAITPKEAFEKYISMEGYHLVYEINQVNNYNQELFPEKSAGYLATYKEKPEIRLVYRPDVNPSFISPFSGQQLTANGEAYTKTMPYRYKDIEETKENRNILLLADMNVGFEGEYFHPTKEITRKELTGLLEKVGYGWYDEADDSSDRLITREEIAMSFIKKLGLEKVAGLKGIYETGYYDEGGINPNYIGAVALAKGLGLMTGNADNNFNPKNNVTRAEAVNLILNFIEVQRNQLY